MPGIRSYDLHVERRERPVRFAVSTGSMSLPPVLDCGSDIGELPGIALLRTGTQVAAIVSAVGPVVVGGVAEQPLVVEGSGAAVHQTEDAKTLHRAGTSSCCRVRARNRIWARGIAPSRMRRQSSLSRFAPPRTLIVLAQPSTL